MTTVRIYSDSPAKPDPRDRARTYRLIRSVSDEPCRECGSGGTIVNREYNRCYDCQDRLDAFNEAYEARKGHFYE